MNEREASISKSTYTFTGTAGLSLADGTMSVCVGIHCASAVRFWSLTAVLIQMWFHISRSLPGGAGMQRGCVSIQLWGPSMTADRKDVLWDVLPLSFASCSEHQLPLSVWRCAPSSCVAARGLLELTTGLAGTGGRTKGLGLGLGLIPGFLALVSDPVLNREKLTLAAEEFPCEAEGLICSWFHNSLDVISN